MLLRFSLLPKGATDRFLTLMCATKIELPVTQVVSKIKVGGLLCASVRLCALVCEDNVINWGTATTKNITGKKIIVAAASSRL
jgi:hypothetical protein